MLTQKEAKKKPIAEKMTSLVAGVIRAHLTIGNAQNFYSSLRGDGTPFGTVLDFHSLALAQRHLFIFLGLSLCLTQLRLVASVSRRVVLAVS